MGNEHERPPAYQPYPPQPGYPPPPQGPTIFTTAPQPTTVVVQMTGNCPNCRVSFQICFKLVES